MFKILLLHISKALGLFYLARKMTYRGLRILCYHGFSLDDEHLFRPKLFMTRELFKQRLEMVARMGFEVIPLSRAVDMLRSGIEPENCLVFTVDDGWQGVEDIAMPLFQEYKFDWTLYLTTYYAEKQTQVMNVALQYFCWKTSRPHVDLAPIKGCRELVQLHTTVDRERLAIDLCKIGEAMASAEERQRFVRAVAAILDINQDDVERNRLFFLISMSTVARMHEAGVDIQLHTHRHHLGGINREKLEEELATNKRSIYESCRFEAEHFCYPSGYYEKQHLQWLTELGIVSATTCKPNLNYTTTPLLELNRFLDGQHISSIEFEAELSGFSDFLRKIKLMLVKYSVREGTLLENA